MQELQQSFAKEEQLEMATPKEFRLIKQSQTLLRDIVEMEGNADKRYRFSICQDIRKRAEEVVHLIRRANRLLPGDEERMKMQLEADELLEQIKDLLWVVGRVLAIGVNREAQIELSIENVQKTLKNWIEFDRKKSVSVNEELYRKAQRSLQQAKEVFEIIKPYYDMNKTERTEQAYNESMARYRIAHENLKQAQQRYDDSVKKLRRIQEQYHKDDSVLNEVLQEIKEKSSKS